MNPISGLPRGDAIFPASGRPLSPLPLPDALDGGGPESPAERGPLQEAFQDFVGQTLFGSMLASMRKTLDQPAYMHGGRTEEVFQQQLDQRIVDDITKASASTIADPMYELFNLQRRAS